MIDRGAEPRREPRLPEPTVLETERLTLRPFSLADVDDVLAYADDPEWSRYTPFVPLPYLRRHAELFVASQVLVDWDENPSFAIVHAGRVAGATSLRVVAAGLARLGYGVARRLWGEGLASEAAAAVVDYGFETRSLAKVFATTEAGNVASVRVMEKLGMTREALLRSARLARRHPRGRIALRRPRWRLGETSRRECLGLGRCALGGILLPW